MQRIYIFYFATFTLAYVYALPIFETDNGEHFYLIPIQRERRETNWDIAKQPNGGTRVSLGHEGVLAEKGGHELIGGGFASQQFGPKTPATVGGSVGYHHVQTGTDIKGTVAKTPQWGTDVSIQASRPLWQPDKNTKLEAYGGASQHLGGPFGNSRPEANFGLQFSHNNNLFSG